MKQWVLFDLDGTLTDSMVGITSAVKYALSKYGIEVKYLKELTAFIGPPLRDSFMKYYGFSEEQALEAIAYYREYYGPKGIFENEVYPGIAPMLEHLAEAGFDLAVATSKPQDYADRILRHFGLRDYFTLVVGSEPDGTRVDKAEVIDYVMRRAQARPEELIMVGDRSHDIEGAKKCGIDSIGVLYGFGNREELEEAGATYIVDSVQDLGSQLFAILEAERFQVRRFGSWDRRLPVSANAVPVSRQIRFGIIGEGDDVDRFCQANRFSKEYELVCQGTARELSKRSDLDAVYISCDYEDRARCCMDMINAGKHVLCRAPMARTYEEMRELFEAADEKQVILMEGIPSIYSPSFEKTLPYIESLGKIRHATFFNCHLSAYYDPWKRGIVRAEFDGTKSGGGLMELGVYPVAVMIRLFGAPKNVQAVAMKSGDGLDLTGTVLMEYEDMVGEAIYSKITDSATPSQLQGEEGSMILCDIDNIKDLRISRRKVDQTIHFEQSDNILHYETRAFIRRVRTGLDPDDSRRVSLETMRVLEKAKNIFR